MTNSIPFTPPDEIHICVVGMGYVGLPLYLGLREHFKCLGIDINTKKIQQLKEQYESSSPKELFHFASVNQLTPNLLDAINVYILTLPTPIDSSNLPDLTSLINACEQIAPSLKRNDLVLIESTLYPGSTEDICIPILEKNSNLTLNQDFFVGYSPERINPGSSEHTLQNTTKVISASNPCVYTYIQSIYQTIISAPIHIAPSIKVAEASKMLENIQRDVNIALINECAQLFHELNISTADVLSTAETKWNFYPVKPGLVGGHCISVDPYYMIHLAKKHKTPYQFMLNARITNTLMIDYITSRIQQKIPLSEASLYILGFTFKANTNDTRNTLIKPLINKLSHSCQHIDLYDPYLTELPKDLCANVNLAPFPSKNRQYTLVILAVDHQIFLEEIDTILSFSEQGAMLFDMQYILPKHPSVEYL